jgi:hypothetical protein
MKKRWLVLPAVVVPLAITSPVTCSCEPDPSTIAGQMSIYHMSYEDVSSAEHSEELARTAFVGRHLSRLTQNGSVDPECKQQSPTKLQCTYWTDNSILYSQGRSVKIQLDGAGIVTNAAVKSIRRVLFLSLGEDE